MDALKHSSLSSAFNQPKAPENRVEHLNLADKDSDTEYTDANIQSDNNVPKIRVQPKILADIGSAVEIMNISSQEKSPKTRINSKF